MNQSNENMTTHLQQNNAFFIIYIIIFVFLVIISDASGIISLS